ncbi:MAG TPA: periplasmic heavy metal sensor [Chlorobaculum sp.]|nr:periplasmic heavy metal sensor [Chlorobaculum sp.]
MNKIFMTALVAGFIGTAGTSYAAANGQPPQCVKRGVEAKADYRDDFSGPGGKYAREKFRKALGLSESQEVRLREMRRNFFQESKPLREELRTLRHDLADESVKGNPDEQKIADLSEKVGRQNTRLAALQSRHLHEVSKVLDHKQIEILLHMRDDFQSRHWNKGAQRVNQ